MILQIPPASHPFHQFAQHRRHPLALLFDDLPGSPSQSRHEPMPLPVSFSPTHSSISLTPPISSASQSRMNRENTAHNHSQKNNRDHFFHDPQGGGADDERKRWPSSSLMRDVPTSCSVPVSGLYFSASRSLPVSRHHHRNSLRALRNITILPGGIRISRETGEDMAPVFNFEEDFLNGGDENAGTTNSRSSGSYRMGVVTEDVGNSDIDRRTRRTRRAHKRSATAPHILTTSMGTSVVHPV